MGGKHPHSDSTARRLQALIEAARHAPANGQAFSEMARLLSPTLYRICLAILRDEHDAEDCVQEALVRLWLSLGRLHDGQHVLAWARKIATRLAIDAWRAQQRRRRKEQELPPSTSKDPIEQTEQRLRLKQQLAKLPIGERSALALQLEGASIAEIAVTLGISPSAAKMRLHRARQRLKLDEEP